VITRVKPEGMLLRIVALEKKRQPFHPEAIGAL
jgi:hypothetical protein